MEKLRTYLATSLLDLVFPPHCFHCGAFGTWLCVAARAQITPLTPGWCARCGRAAPAGATSCLRCTRQLNLRALQSLFPYTGTVEQVIQAAKFHQATIGFELLIELTDAGLLSASTRDTVLIPLPSSAAHEQRRGYNQAERLAQLLAHRTGGRVVDQLSRVRWAVPQVGLSAAERWQNVTDLYQWSGEPLTRQRCVLIDDVSTTGATLRAASLALKLAGAWSVQAIVLAQTTPNHHDRS